MPGQHKTVCKKGVLGSNKHDKIHIKVQLVPLLVSWSLDYTICSLSFCNAGSRIPFFFLIMKEFDLLLRTTLNIPQDMVFSWNTVLETLGHRMTNCSVLSFVYQNPIREFIVSSYLIGPISPAPSWIYPLLSIPSGPHVTHPLVGLSSSIISLERPSPILQLE